MLQPRLILFLYYRYACFSRDDKQIVTITKHRKLTLIRLENFSTLVLTCYPRITYPQFFYFGSHNDKTNILVPSRYDYASDAQELVVLQCVDNNIDVLLTLQFGTLVCYPQISTNGNYISYVTVG